MTPFLRSLAQAMLLIACVSMAPMAAHAQGNLFAPAVRVNDGVVTQYELNQRILFFRLLNAPGDLRQTATDRLVEERLQLQEARRLGISIEEEQVRAGMEEFASRGELNVEQFVELIGRAGVDEETFRDFVRAGLVWRAVVQSQFGPRVQVTEAEIDRALALGQGDGGARVLLSEIFLIARTPAERAQAERRAEDIRRITTIPAFASAARRFSAAPSRGRGGRQDWLPIANLPPQIRSQILTLAPGEVTDPINVPNAIALFQLRELQETGGQVEDTVAVEFARYFIPGGRTEAALQTATRVEARVDTCDDLYGVAKGQPEEALLRDVLPIEEIPTDVAIELAKLDEGEVSTALTTAGGEALVFLMLCGRTLGLGEDVDREQIRQNLFGQRLESYASGLLSELRADAVIVDLQ